MNVVTQPADFAGSTILIVFEGKNKLAESFINYSIFCGMP